MWNPGFDHVERRRARLHGYRRRPCVASVHYRGAPDRPGVVMGLDRGGACRGFAYRVAAEAVAGVVGYLDARELIYPVYRRRRLPVTVFDDSGARRRVTALTYVVDRADPLYLGDRGFGLSGGVCRDRPRRRRQQPGLFAAGVASSPRNGYPRPPLGGPAGRRRGGPEERST